MGTTSPSVLDLTHLETALGGDRGLMTEILCMYEDTAPADLRALGRAIEDGAVSAVVKTAHTLKGSSANVGAQRVSVLAGEIEQIARGGGLDGVGERYRALREVFDETLRATHAFRAA
jgi:HPt (histidine-containing phosphotransfer) domain-containing protein